jgi:hypothetical protein
MEASMERLRRHREEEISPPLRELPTPPPVAAPIAAPLAETVQVIWGPIAENMAVGGMSVGDVRGLLQGPYNIPPQAAALVNGERVGAGHQLAAGDVLEFARASGEKGAGRP